MKTLLFLLVLALAASAAGSASASGGGSKPTVTVKPSAYGKILFDGSSRALYAFGRDPRGRSVCSGACSKKWPPYVVTGRLKPGPNVKSSLLATTKRADGRLQVTYGGRPLYYYIGDTVGQVLCQNVSEFGGRWLVIRANGRLVH